MVGLTVTNKHLASHGPTNSRHSRLASCGIKKIEALIRGLGIRTSRPILFQPLPYARTPPWAGDTPPAAGWPAYVARSWPGEYAMRASWGCDNG